jgi:hypothetical protein
MPKVSAMAVPASSLEKLFIFSLPFAVDLAVVRRWISLEDRWPVLLLVVGGHIMA